MPKMLMYRSFIFLIGAGLTFPQWSAASAGFDGHHPNDIKDIISNDLEEPIDDSYKTFRWVTKVRMGNRTVDFALPTVKPAKNGFPVLMVFQGAFAPSKFHRTEEDKDNRFGLYYESQVIQKFIAAGWAVVIPRALAKLAWQTNLYNGQNYKRTSDYKFMVALLSAMNNQILGQLDMNQVYAMGLSSGGYMTSRLGEEFPDSFKALFNQSGSYMSCKSRLCSIPERVNESTPPTFLRAGTKDLVVPYKTTVKYYERLLATGIQAELLLDEDLGHRWPEDSAAVVFSWFMQFANN